MPPVVSVECLGLREAGLPEQAGAFGFGPAVFSVPGQAGEEAELPGGGVVACPAEHVPCRRQRVGEFHDLPGRGLR